MPEEEIRTHFEMVLVFHRAGDRVFLRSILDSEGIDDVIFFQK